MRWAGLVVRMGRGEERTKFSWGNICERGHLKILRVYEFKTSQCIFNRGWVVCTGLILLRTNKWRAPVNTVMTTRV
jgi:hypothetical protein